MDEDSGMDGREGTNLMMRLKMRSAHAKGHARDGRGRGRDETIEGNFVRATRAQTIARARRRRRDSTMFQISGRRVGGKEPLGIFLSRDSSWRGAGKYFQVGKYFREERLTDASDALDECAGGPVCGGANTIFFIYRGNKDKPLIKYSLHEQLVRRAH